MHEEQTTVSYAVLTEKGQWDRTYCLANYDEVDGLNEDIAKLIQSQTPFRVRFITVLPER